MRSFPAALIVVFLVFPLFMAALVAVSVSTWVLDRSFYTAILSDSRLYQVPDGLSGATRITVDLPGRPRLSLSASPRALKEVLPPDYVRNQALGVLGSMFDFLEGKAVVFDPLVDLDPIRKALAGPEGRRFARLVAEDLPVGSPGGSFVIRPGRLPDSRPSTISVERAAALIEAGLPAFAGAIPMRIRLTDAFGWGEVVRGQEWQGSVLRVLVIADVVILFIACAFWVAAAFLGGADARRRLQWMGWSLLAPAAFVFLIGLFITIAAFAAAARSGLASADTGTLRFSPAFATAVYDAARFAMRRIGIGFLATGAVAAGVCMALLGVSWSMPQERRQAA
ncbi:MAG TPA: hypothetical protein VMV03_15600 [Spirochaetia bacterium]|nr:hypothetical protein [Spirochaetia bacterium]